MRVGVLGSGTVGQTIGGKADELGHEVVLGTRDVAALLARGAPEGGEGESFAAWHRRHPHVTPGTFEDAAAHGEVLFNCTAGGASLAALRLAGEGHLAGKLLIDVSNALDFSSDGPPTLSVLNTDSVGESIQREFPRARVVKSLNTMNASLMVDPGLVAGGDHHVFVSGDDPGAKAEATAILRDWFGWREVIDLGDISTARGPEMYLPLWLRLMGTMDGPLFNIKVVR